MSDMSNLRAVLTLALQKAGPWLLVAAGSLIVIGALIL